ncbi:MAG: RDD family protein [Flavobacteriales bacterium]|nr:RDD family protein [Flavobacteriales bacterium]
MKTIDIVTSNNVTIQYELGSIAQRFLGLVLDCAIFYGYAILAYTIAGVIFAWVASWAPGSVTWDSNGDPIDVFYFGYVIIALIGCVLVGILFIPVFFYRFLSEYLFSGRTVGKMATGLRVIKVNGSVPSITDYFLRSSFMLIDFWMSIGSFGFLTSSSSDRNQRIGDMVAGTVVIRLRPSVSYSIKDILSIKTAENYEPQYPQVTVFTDEDMLLIKNAIDRVRRFPNKRHKKLVVELARKAQNLLSIENPPKNKLSFLKTLLQDYIVLTRS